MNSHINNKDDDNVPALSEEFVQHTWALREGPGLPGSHPGNELEVLWTDPEPLLQQPRRWASPEEALESSKELPRYGQMKTA